MFASTSIVTLSSIVLSSALVIPRFSPPVGWWTAGLESYDQYHTRYLALDCELQHNTTFFDTCCHPMLVTQKLSDRPDECDPANDCADDEEPSAAPAPAPASSSVAAATQAKSTPKATPKSTPAPVNVGSDPDSGDDNQSDSPAAKPTSAASKTTTAKPAPSPTKASSSGSGSGSNSGSNDKTGSGDGTFFTQNGVAGACGTVHADSSKVVALDIGLYGNNCNGQSSLCGKTVTITNTNNGKSVDAIVADCCPTCNSFGSIDMSIGAFTEIATEEQGMVPITWALHI